MVMNLYALRDKLAEEYAPLFEAKSDQVAIRVVKQMMARMPEIVLSDFELYYFGSFNHVNGQIQVKENPELIPFRSEEVKNA